MRETHEERAHPADRQLAWWAVVLEWTRRHILAWGGAVAAIALIVGLLFYGYGPAHRQLEIGRVAQAVGAPTLSQIRQSSPRKGDPGSRVFLGDRIETGDADKAELVFKDGTTLRLGYNTVIEIPKLTVAKGDAKATLLRPPEIRLLRGQVWTKVQKLTNAPHYAIRTEAATAVARGTEFGVKIQRPASTNASAPITILTVKEGAVDFSNSLGSVQATAMTESTASADGAPSQPVRLQIIKTFDLAPGKQFTVGPQTAALDFDVSMVYPYGWTGFYLRTTQEDGFAAARQLRVVRVRPGSPGDQAGMAVGDLVTHVNGRPVTNIEEVLRPLTQRQGTSVELGIARGNISHTVSLTTIRNPNSLPFTDVRAELAAHVFDATWPLIEAACEDVISSNRWQELEQKFRSAMEGYPGVAALHNNLAVWYNTANKLGPAIQQLRQAVELHPENPFYHFNLSSVFCGIGNFERCVEEAEAVVKLVPDWPPGIFQLALAYSFVDRHDDALAALERGLATNPSSVDLWGAKAFILSAGRKPDEAVSAALKAIELEPSYGYSWSLLGLARWGSRELAESEAAYRKAIELDPGDADAYHSLAIKIISRILSRLPEDVTDASPEEMAIELWRERPPEELAIIAEAERYGRRAIELRKSFVTAYVDLAQILLTRGAVDEAEKILRTGHANGPERSGGSKCAQRAGLPLRHLGHTTGRGPAACATGRGNVPRRLHFRHAGCRAFPAWRMGSR